jgi:hypothetical protein
MMMKMSAGMSNDFVLEAWDSDEELQKLQVEYADYKKQCELMICLICMIYLICKKVIPATYKGIHLSCLVQM